MASSTSNASANLINLHANDHSFRRNTCNIVSYNMNGKSGKSSSNKSLQLKITRNCIFTGNLNCTIENWRNMKFFRNLRRFRNSVMDSVSQNQYSVVDLMGVGLFLLKTAYQKT